MNKRLILYYVFLFVLCFSCKENKQNSLEKPTICIVGGTPSTTDILTFIPDSLKVKYNIISFNRPGFGGSKYEQTTENLLYELAEKAGLKTHDYAVIGISGGGPISMLLASKFKLKHCGVISGMVNKEAYFKFADSAITKELMTNVLIGYDTFKEAVLKFPNIDQIAKQAGTVSEDMLIKASYNDLNYVLSDHLYSAINKDIHIDWWHGENDLNVPLKSAQLFLKDYKYAILNIIPNVSHEIDSIIYIENLIDGWESN